MTRLSIFYFISAIEGIFGDSTEAPELPETPAAQSGLDSEEVLMVVLVSVFGALVLALLIFLIYHCYVVKRQGPKLKSVSVPILSRTMLTVYMYSYFSL